MQLFYWILTPISFIFGGYKKLLSKIFKLKSDDTVTDAELISLVKEAEEDGTLKEDESELVRSALEFDDLKVEDILVPPMDEIMRTFRENTYSRLPVYKDKIDNIVGLIHERDFYNAYLNGEKDIASAIQNIVFTSEYTHISTLLKQLQKQKIHMAAVSDEYGWSESSRSKISLKNWSGKSGTNTTRKKFCTGKLQRTNIGWTENATLKNFLTSTALKRKRTTLSRIPWEVG